MKKIYLIIPFLILLAGCAEDESIFKNPFVVAFNKLSNNFAKVNNAPNIKLIFSEKAESSGFVKIAVKEESTVYGVDYTTNPVVENNEIILTFSEGQKGLDFQFKSLLETFTENDQGKKVTFTIKEINYRGQSKIQGYSSHTVSFENIIEDTAEPKIGGPNQQFQVYYDLSSGEFKSVLRDSWDLGFYSGEKFRVILNSSIYMAARAFETSNIDEITKDNIPQNWFTEVAVGTFDSANEEYIDAPSGDIDKTAIQEIVVNPDDNKVYLINLGFEVGKTTPNVGSVAVAGDPRGWKKIKITRKDNGYLLQYAELDDTTHNEIFIPKTPEFNFNHFSFNTNQILQVQPLKNEWDLCFTVFTNLVTNNAGESSGSYGFSDFVSNNLLANAKAFMIKGNDEDFENYVLNESEAETKLLNDQRAIGSRWRSVFNGVYPNKFFILKDPEGNWYKIKFLAFKNENGERGYPKFKYKLLN